jgi:zinc protease
VSTSKPKAHAKLVMDGGTVVLCEEEHALPLVHVGVSLRTGSLHDPKDLPGTVRLCARMLRMGTRKLTAAQVEERIDAMGAHLGVSCAPSYVHIGGAVVAHNLDKFVALLGELLRGPAMRTADLARAKRETAAELTALCDDDRALVARHFRGFAFGEHPYGRPIVGTSASVPAIARKHVLAHYEKHFVSDNAVIGFSGAITPERARDLVAKHLSLPRGKAPREKLPAPRFKSGRRVLIVDKPERTQTQILIGTLGTHVQDADHVPLLVANVTFGGLFTARLTREVRSKRGMSYGASSSLGHDRQRELWSMWTFPSAKQARECIDLELRLMEEWIDDGVRDAELRTAKGFLEKSHAFEVDTAQKRLDQRVETEVFDLPADYHDAFTARVHDVTRQSANAALEKRLSHDDLAIVVVATASELGPQLAKIPRVKSLHTVPFDRV